MSELADPTDVTTLRRLGFRDDDVADLQRLLPTLTPDDRARVDHATDLLLEHVGRIDRRQDPLNGLDLALGDQPQAVALLALIRMAPATVAELRRRGIDEDMAWRSVSDLGQQVHVHRGAHGRFGFSAARWSGANAAGSHLWLGRLQFTLEPDEGPAIGVHIPATGPLSPEEVDHSLAMARDVAVDAWAEYDVTRFVCHSWLLDQGMVTALPSTSNIRRFAERFTPYGTPDDGRRDFLFFGFHREPRDDEDVDLDGLPQDTSMQRAAVARLREGTPTCQRGWMPLD